MESTALERLVLRVFPPLPEAQWRAGTLLSAAVGLAAFLSHAFLAQPFLLYPACALALAGLYLQGLRLWPFAFVGVLAGAGFGGAGVGVAVAATVVCVLQAAVGARLLRDVGRIDPLFRRFRDSVWTLGVGALTCVISASAGVGITRSGASVTGDPYLGGAWIAWFVAEFFAYIVIVPFVLRWFAKPRFNRTRIEAVETVTIFGLLLALCWCVFVLDVQLVLGIPLRYFILIPLFWIALRLRPRFVSLALVLMAAFGIAGLFVGPLAAGPAEFYADLFEFQAYLVTLAMMFFLITCLEEDRRLNRNLMRSQLATLENAVSRIAAESEARERFIAILAHELRNPLAPIANGIELLRYGGERTKDELETLAMMEDRMGVIRRLLDDLLDISRISEGKVSLQKAPVHLNDVIARAVVSTEHYFRERHQDLDVKVPKSKVRVEGDSVRLEQAVSNLLTNSSKYTDSGGRIQVQLRTHGSYAEVTVTDNGIGIAAHDLEAVFTPFHQVDGAVRGKAGLGIGLALVKGFIEMHGGSIEARSEGRGKGSQFFVRLPLLPASAA